MNGQHGTAGTSSGKTFLGAGVAWPVQCDAAGSLGTAAYEEAVRQSVWIILSTSKGERPMRPDFGCGIHDLVFEPLTAATVGRITSTVRDALLRHEPRIDVRDVQATVGQEPGLLLIDIDYEVRATNNAFNLVYPFYLEGGGA
jgi:phage baseplate assembly protein W